MPANHSPRPAQPGAPGVARRGRGLLARSVPRHHHASRRPFGRSSPTRVRTRECDRRSRVRLGLQRGNRGYVDDSVTWDPPVKDPVEIKTRCAVPESTWRYSCMSSPARLRTVDVAVLTVLRGRAASPAPGRAAFLSSGVRVAKSALAGVGARAQPHYEDRKNPASAAADSTGWTERRCSAPAVRKRGTSRRDDSRALATSGSSPTSKRGYGTVARQM